MRRSLLVVLSLAAAACARNSSNDAAAKPSIVIAAPKPRAASVSHPTQIAYTTRTDAGVRELFLAREDDPAKSVRVSAEGVDTTFAAAIGGGEALLAEHEETGSIVRLVRLGADGARTEVAQLVPGLYDGVHEAKLVGGAFAILFDRRDSSAKDLLLVQSGKAPRLVAGNAKLVTVAAGRVAYLSGTALKSVASDGTGEIVLGAGTDTAVDVTGDRLLVNTGHEARLVTIRGDVVLSLAKPGVDASAVGITADRIAFLRGGALYASALDGSNETLLAAADLAPRGLGVADGGVVLWGDTTGALLASDARDASSRVLDPDAGQNVAIQKVAGSKVVYLGDTPHWLSLRSASLDGSGANVLCEKVTWIPQFVALQGDRVVFHRNLSAQLEGGRVYSVDIHGGDLTPVGAFVQGANGDVTAAPLADQDFEGVTPNGALVLEAEMEAVGSAQLYVLGDDAAPARLVTDKAHARFAGIVR